MSPFSVTSTLAVSCSASLPSAEAPDKIVQHEELLEHRHALPLPAEFREQLSQPAPPRQVESERLREVLLGMGGGVRGDIVGQGGRDAPALEVYPLGVGDAVGLSHLAERAAEAPGARERPVVIEKGVAELV